MRLLACLFAAALSCGTEDAAPPQAERATTPQPIRSLPAPPFRPPPTAAAPPPAPAAFTAADCAALLPRATSVVLLSTTPPTLCLGHCPNVDGRETVEGIIDTAAQRAALASEWLLFCPADGSCGAGCP